MNVWKSGSDQLRRDWLPSVNPAPIVKPISIDSSRSSASTSQPCEVGSRNAWRPSSSDSPYPFTMALVSLRLPFSIAVAAL